MEFGTKILKEYKNQEASIILVPIHDYLFTRNASALYGCMTVCFGTVISHILISFSSDIKMMDLHIIGDF